MADLGDEESVQIKGSGSSVYTLKNSGGVYSCTCPAWTHQAIGIERRSCKHLRAYRGEAEEAARVGNPAPITSRPSASGGASSGDDDGPPVLLAHKWETDVDVTGYWLSEKLDGVRAYWDGKQFLSRLGNRFYPPEFFVEGFPDHPLDGELVTGFLCKSLHMTHDLRIANEQDRFVEVSADAVYVTAEAAGVREYLDGLRAGRDDLLESALTAEPLIHAYVDVIAALCGPATDDLAEAARAEALETLMALVKRRAPMLFGLLIPDGVQGERPFVDERVRSWASRVSAQRGDGPFFSDPPAGPEIEIPPQLQREEYWPTPDLDRWLTSIAERWRDSPLQLTVTQYTTQARALPRGLALGVLRQIEQLDGFRTYVQSGVGGALVYDQPRPRADAAEARLRAAPAEARPLIALAALSDREAVCSRATRLLAGVNDAALFDMCLRLIISTAPPMPWGADAYTLAEVAIGASTVDDALVSRLLVALQAGSPVAAILASQRIERNDVFSALIAQYVRVATAGAWSSDAQVRRHLTEDDGLAVDAICAFLNVSRPHRRSTCEPVLRVDGPRACVAPPYFCADGPHLLPRPAIAYALTKPHRPGPLGPITRALTKRPEKRTLDTLRSVASNSRVAIDTRDEAAKGLVALRAAGASEVAASVARAWERYWRI